MSSLTMASSSSLLLFLLVQTAFLFLTSPNVHAQSPLAPGPAPSGPLNLTAILEKGGQYTTFIRLLDATQIGNQIVNQINNSNQGLTLLAPNDNAFNNLKAGMINGLSVQEQVALVQYHVLPQFYTLEMFDTISNPARTLATGNDGGLYYLNFTSSANQVNVSTGIVEAQINNALHSDFPLAVYQLDKVLLPLDLFGPKPPKKAQPPSVPSSKPNSTSASSGASENSQPNAGSRVGNVRWSFVIGIWLMVMGTLV